LEGSDVKKIIACLLLILLVLTVSSCSPGGAEIPLPPASADNSAEGTENTPSSDDIEDEEEGTEPDLPEPQQDIENGFELEGLTLFDHDLTGSSHLEPHILRGPSDAEYAVSVIVGGFADARWPSYIYWETETIAIFAKLWYDTETLWFDVEDAQGLVASRLLEDMEFFGSFTETGGISLDIHIPFHVSVGGQSAFVGFGTELMGDALLFLYFAQVIPDSDYILAVELALYLDFLTQEDIAILEELSQHMGFDFLVYLP